MRPAVGRGWKEAKSQKLPFSLPPFNRSTGCWGNIGVILDIGNSCAVVVILIAGLPARAYLARGHRGDRVGGSLVDKSANGHGQPRGLKPIRTHTVKRWVHRVEKSGTSNQLKPICKHRLHPGVHILGSYYCLQMSATKPNNDNIQVDHTEGQSKA